MTFSFCQLTQSMFQNQGDIQSVDAHKNSLDIDTQRPFIFIARVFKNTKWISRGITAKLDPLYCFLMQNIFPQPAIGVLVHLTKKEGHGTAGL
jgi:hypothetical protein